MDKMDFWKAVNERLKSLGVREAEYSEITYCRIYQLSVDEAADLLANKK